MKLRTTSIEKAERELRDREQRRTELAAEIERAELEVAAADSALRAAESAESAAFAARGDVGEARRRRAEAERALEVAKGELSRLRSYVPEFDRRVEEAREQVRVARRDAAMKAYAEVVHRRNAAAEEVGNALGALAAAVADLERLREAADKARAEVQQLSSLREEVDEVDEPDFSGGWREITPVLEKGPRRPRARSAAAIAEVEAEHARQHEALIRDAVHTFLTMAPPIPGEDDLRRSELDRLEPKLRREAERRIEERLEAERNRRQAAQAERPDESFVRLARGS